MDHRNKLTDEQAAALNGFYQQLQKIRVDCDHDELTIDCEMCEIKALRARIAELENVGLEVKRLKLDNERYREEVQKWKRDFLSLRDTGGIERPMEVHPECIGDANGEDHHHGDPDCTCWELYHRDQSRRDDDTEEPAPGEDTSYTGQIADLEKDKARLDWLIENQATVFESRTGLWRVEWDDIKRERVMGGWPREAIDAAMKESP